MGMESLPVFQEYSLFVSVFISWIFDRIRNPTLQTWYNLVCLPGLERIKKGRKLFAYGSLEPMLFSSVLIVIVRISYWEKMSSYKSNPYYRKTEIDIEKWFSQKVWNYINAILSVVFVISFHRVFMTSTKRWFKFVFTVPENWLNWFSWNFFSRYLGHMSRSERSLFEISWKLRSTDFFGKCVRPVFMTLFCKNTEEKIVQTWNFVHI